MCLGLECSGAHAEVRGHIYRVSSLLPLLHGFWSLYDKYLYPLSPFASSQCEIFFKPLKHLRWTWLMKWVPHIRQSFNLVHIYVWEIKHCMLFYNLEKQMRLWNPLRLHSSPDLHCCCDWALCPLVSLEIKDLFLWHSDIEFTAENISGWGAWRGRNNAHLISLHGNCKFLTWERKEWRFFFSLTCDVFISSFWFTFFPLFNFYYVWGGTLATVHIYRSEELLCAVAGLYLFSVLWIEFR